METNECQPAIRTHPDIERIIAIPDLYTRAIAILYKENVLACARVQNLVDLSTLRPAREELRTVEVSCNSEAAIKLTCSCFCALEKLTSAQINLEPVLIPRMSDTTLRLLAGTRRRINISLRLGVLGNMEPKRKHILSLKVAELENKLKQVQAEAVARVLVVSIAEMDVEEVEELLEEDTECAIRALGAR